MAAWGQTNWIDKANTDWYDSPDENGWYHISTAEDLAGLARLVNEGTDNFSGKTIKLDADIRLNDTSDWGSWETTPPKYSWTPIGTTLQNQFYGTFDGQGYTVSGIYISVDETNQGLFGCVGKSGIIWDLTVAESYIYGRMRVGGVVGYNYGKVLNCSNSGTVSGNSNIGGIVGVNVNEAEVSNCSNSGTVRSDSGFVGGVVGYNAGQVSNCSNSGTVIGSGTSSNVGGVVGHNNTGQVSNCSNSGTVEGLYYIGGVIGSNHNGTASYCSNSGTVRSDEDWFVGGVVGSNAGQVSNCYYLEGTCDKGIGGDSGTTEKVKMKTEAEYKSGEVLLLLDLERETWGQDFNNGGYPVPLGSLSAEEQAAAKVYSATFTYTLPDAQEESVEIKYGNSDTQLTEPEVKAPDGYTFAWDKEVPTKFGTTDLTFKGTFTEEPAIAYTLTINQPENGTISATADGKSINSGDNVAEGATVILTVTPNEGYELETLTVTKADGTTLTVTDNTFTMPASNVTVTATFTKKSYSLTITQPTEGGTISAKVNGEEVTQVTQVTFEETVTLIATPAEGYELTELKYNETTIDITGEPYQFTMPASDVTVTATFTEIEPGPEPTYYTIAVGSTANGTVTPSLETAEAGEEVTLMVNPDPGYELGSLSVTDVYGSSVDVYGYTFTMPASNVTVRATFTEEETEPDPGPEPEPEPEPEPVPEPEPEPEPAYFTLDFDDHPCEGVTLNSNLTAVEEGGTLYLYVEKEDETLYDYDNMRIYAKRGANADWEELTEDPKRPGVYPIERIWTDIFIKVEGVEPIEPPTAIAGVQGVQVYAREGAILVHTPTEARVVVVAMNGTVKASGKQTGLRRYALPRGFYVVWVDGESFKVAN